MKCRSQSRTCGLSPRLKTFRHRSPGSPEAFDPFREPFSHSRKVLRHESVQGRDLRVAAGFRLKLKVIRSWQNSQSVVLVATGQECRPPSCLVLCRHDIVVQLSKYRERWHPQLPQCRRQRRR